MSRVKSQVPVNDTSRRPLGTNNLPVRDLEVLETYDGLKLLARKEYRNIAEKGGSK